MQLKYFIIILMFLALVSVSCKKDKQDSNVAKVPVDFYLYLNEPSNVNLNAIGGWLYVNAGTKGVIVYRSGDETFTALEQNCPYDPDKECSLVEVYSGISAVDSCCSSQFSIYDGSVINGPATQPMYRYQSVLNGTVLHIYN